MLQTEANKWPPTYEEMMRIQPPVFSSPDLDRLGKMEAVKILKEEMEVCKSKGDLHAACALLSIIRRIDEAKSPAGFVVVSQGSDMILDKDGFCTRSRSGMYVFDEPVDVEGTHRGRDLLPKPDEGYVRESLIASISKDGRIMNWKVVDKEVHKTPDDPAK